MMTRVVVASAVVIALCSCEGPRKETPAKDGIDARPAGAVKRAKEGVEKANEAGVKRNEDAYDRATKSENVERGAPSR